VDPLSVFIAGEQAMNELKNTNIKHLRPGYFFSNFLGNVGMVKNMNIIGGNFGGANFKMVLADTNDVAEVAFEELSNLNFKVIQFAISPAMKGVQMILQKLLVLLLANPNFHG
jgi:hypothetical protein